MSSCGGNECVMVKIDKYFKFISSSQIIKIFSHQSESDYFVNIFAHTMRRWEQISTDGSFFMLNIIIFFEIRKFNTVSE